MSVTKLLFLLTLLFSTMFYAQAARAQGKDTLAIAGIREKAEAVASRLQRELSLTDAQKHQIVSIATSRMERFKTSVSRMSPASRRSVDDDTQQQLARVLTLEQLKQYQALREDTRRQKQAYARDHRQEAPSQEDEEMDF